MRAGRTRARRVCAEAFDDAGRLVIVTHVLYSVWAGEGRHRVSPFATGSLVSCKLMNGTRTHCARSSPLLSLVAVSRVRRVPTEYIF